MTYIILSAALTLLSHCYPTVPEREQAERRTEPEIRNAKLAQYRRGVQMYRTKRRSVLLIAGTWTSCRLIGNLDSIAFGTAQFSEYAVTRPLETSRKSVKLGDYSLGIHLLRN